MNGGVAAAGGRLAHRPELDGLRALSVIAVVIHHVPPGRAAFPAAFIGVDVFFALSGALITRILLTELDRTGTLSLGRFYLRRLRRLYPGLLTMIVAVSLAALVLLGGAFVVKYLPDAALAALYLAAFVVPERPIALVGHTWSLSIEEAFYLVWPVTLRALAKRGLRPVVLLLAFVVLAVPLWRMHLWWDEMASSSRLYFALDTRADAIAWGALAGLAVHSGLAERIARPLGGLAWLSGAGLLVLTRIGNRSETWYAVWGYSLASALSAIVVARLFVRPSKILASAPLVWLGKRSYSLYLWHVPVFLLGGDRGVSFFVLVPLAMALAMVSYRFVELPLRAKD